MSDNVAKPEATPPAVVWMNYHPNDKWWDCWPTIEKAQQSTLYVASNRPFHIPYVAASRLRELVEKWREQAESGSRAVEWRWAFHDAIEDVEKLLAETEK